MIYRTMICCRGNLPALNAGTPDITTARRAIKQSAAGPPISTLLPGGPHRTEESAADLGTQLPSLVTTPSGVQGGVTGSRDHSGTLLSSAHVQRQPQQLLHMRRRCDMSLSNHIVSYTDIGDMSLGTVGTPFTVGDTRAELA